MLLPAPPFDFKSTGDTHSSSSFESPARRPAGVGVRGVVLRTDGGLDDPAALPPVLPEPVAEPAPVPELAPLTPP
jgi:hypothetical protein